MTKTLVTFNFWIVRLLMYSDFERLGPSNISGSCFSPSRSFLPATKYDVAVMKSGRTKNMAK